MATSDDLQQRLTEALSDVSAYRNPGDVADAYRDVVNPWRQP